MKLIFVVRPLSYLFRKNWYSLYRWKNIQAYENKAYRLIDAGIITVGFVRPPYR